MKFSNWFSSIDNKLFTAICLLMIFGFIMTMTASPAVAERISVNHFYFIQKQFIYLVCALILMITFSLLNEKALRKVIFIGFIITIIMLIIVLFLEETKGSKRWLNIIGFSFQPSEFLKPFYNSIIAMTLARRKNDLKTFCLLIICHFLIISLLLLEPDFGMAILISSVFSIQLFIAEFNIIWLIFLTVTFLLGAVSMYYLFPHVTKRIDKFLNDSEANYQVKKSLESYYNGNLWGKGPGEGVVKYQLPDAHTDFIFPVAAEELGIVFCLFVICLIVFLTIRSFINIIRMRHNKYKVYLGISIISYFAIQSFFNIAVTLNLLPTKGMTLPFISCGGSSLLTQAMLFGIFLNITRNTTISTPSTHARL